MLLPQAEVCPSWGCDPIGQWRIREEFRESRESSLFREFGESFAVLTRIQTWSCVLCAVCCVLCPWEVLVVLRRVLDKKNCLRQGRSWLHVHPLPIIHPLIIPRLDVTVGDQCPSSFSTYLILSTIAGRPVLFLNTIGLNLLFFPFSRMVFTLPSSRSTL
jgi:hypothetical protein